MTSFKSFGDLARTLATNGDPAGRLATSHAKLRRGIVWCRACGHSQPVNSRDAMAGGAGWPKHCGATMTIDSPEEQ